MFNNLFAASFKHRSLQVLLAGVALSAGIAREAASLEVAKGQLFQPENNSKLNFVKQIKTAEAVLPEGVYLYGESPRREQVGKEYLVFEVKKGKVKGAFYMPASEYSCFQGTINSKKLNLSVRDPYEQKTHSHSIALEKTSQVATAGRHLPTPDTIGLRGYYQISDISNNDQRMLNACKAG